MTLIDYTTINIGKYYKTLFLDWFKTHKLPIRKFKDLNNKKYIYPDNQYIWLTLFKYMLNQLEKEYYIYRNNNIGIEKPTNHDNNKFDNDYYLIYLNSKYDEFEIVVKIPYFDKIKNKKKYCFSSRINSDNFDELNDTLNNTSNKLLLITLYKKILTAKQFRRLNFDFIDYLNFRSLHSYNLFDIIKYMDITKFSQEESKNIILYLHSKSYKFETYWEHYKNHYISISRGGTHYVRRATVTDILSQQAIKINLKYKSIIDINYIYIPKHLDMNLDYMGIKDIIYFIKPFRYKSILQQYSNHEEYFIGIVNGFGIKHGTSKHFYKKFKRQLKLILYENPYLNNVLQDCLKYTYLNPDNNSKKINKYMEHSKYDCSIPIQIKNINKIVNNKTKK